jgi:hypothetical protein
MARIMADAIHDNVGSIPVNSVQMVAGYLTGTPDIIWTAADWDKFSGMPEVTIDQGYGDTRATEAHAVIFDVELGAFQPSQAEALLNASTAPRPTIYVNQANLLETLESAQQSPNFKGDVWLSYPGWTPNVALPTLPAGCQYVAIQDVFTSTYDLSTVFDATWPNAAETEDDPMEVGLRGGRVDQVAAYLTSAGYASVTVLLSGIAGFRTQAPLDPSLYAQHLVLGVTADSSGNATITAA